MFLYILHGVNRICLVKYYSLTGMVFKFLFTVTLELLFQQILESGRSCLS